MIPEEEELLRKLKEIEGLAADAVEREHLRMAQRDVEEFLKRDNPECEMCHREMMRGKPDYDYYCAYCQLGFDYTKGGRDGKLKLVPMVY